MASGSRASWMAVASISVVEVLKDQAGLCRWNYALRSLHQKARKEMGSFSQKRKVMPFSDHLMAGRREALCCTKEEEKAKRSEESFRKVMYLSCWGPN